jgi:predicted DNA-binding antitoxin AbrB/MazE fold protein
MAIVVEAVYEDGVLKPTKPLPLREHEMVQITVLPCYKKLTDLYGIMGFQGTVEEADYIATHADLDYPPPPENP